MIRISGYLVALVLATGGNQTITNSAFISRRSVMPPAPRRMLEGPLARAEQLSFVPVKHTLVVQVTNGATINLSADLVNWTAIKASVPVGATLEAHFPTEIGRLYIFVK